MNKISERIRKEIPLYGYHDIILLGKWNGHVVYEPIFSDSQIRYTGYPQYILVKDGKFRWTKSMDEIFEIMDTFIS